MRSDVVNSVTSAAQKVANFLRLLDEEGRLSLTNVAVIVLLVKIGLSTSVNLAEAGALLTVLSGYHFKSYQAKKPKAVVEAPNSKLMQMIDEIKTDVGRLKLAGAFKNVSSS